MYERVVFLGSKSAGLRLLERLHFVNPERLVGAITLDDGADARSALDHLRQFTTEKRIPLHVARNRTHSEALLSELRPDLVFVLGWYWLLTKGTLDSVPGGFIGVHFSPLPKYRGTSPVVWQIINGENHIGLSVFSMTEGLDEGPLWLQAAIPLMETDYVADVLAKLEAETVQLISDLYPRISTGTSRPQPQDAGPPTYCAARLPSDGEINWSSPARSVYNFIRAQSSPYPGAFTWLGEEKLPIWKASLFREQYYGTPGQIAAISSAGVIVVCGDHHAVILHTVGANAQAQEVLHSVKLRFPQHPVSR